MSLSIDTSHSSPNFSSRHGTPISMIVLHATVGSFASSLAWLTNPSSNVSSHYLINRDGSIYQLVDPRNAAWHAGKSMWHDLDSEAIQECSIGVEMANLNTGHDPYPPKQFNACLMLCQDLVKLFPITSQYTVTHAQIAIPSGRKTDPAGFPMAAFMQALYPAPRIVHAGPYGSIARQDYMAAAPAAAYFPPGTPIEIDDFAKNSYKHAASGVGFIAEGDLLL